MNYSIIPDEIIYDEWDGAELDSHQEMDIGGCQCIVEPMEENQFKIVKLISSNPGDYLNPQYQPGNVIKMTVDLG